MSKLETYNLSVGQLEAIELVALSPTTSNKDLAKSLDIALWMKEASEITQKENERENKEIVKNKLKKRDK